MTDTARDIIDNISEAKNSKFTITTLLLAARNHRDKFNRAGRVAVTEMKPIIANKSLVIKGEAFGTKVYQLTMVFHSVRYSPTKDRTHKLTVSLGNGEYMYAGFLSKSRNPVQIRCNCPDFYFTWQHWDAQVKALSGPNKPKYIRKTQTYPERNPLHVPGLCKHLIGLIERLEKSGILIK